MVLRLLEIIVLSPGVVVIVAVVAVVVVVVVEAVVAVVVEAVVAVVVEAVVAVVVLSILVVVAVIAVLVLVEVVVVVIVVVVIVVVEVFVVVAAVTVAPLQTARSQIQKDAFAVESRRLSSPTESTGVAVVLKGVTGRSASIIDEVESKWSLLVVVVLLLKEVVVGTLLVVMATKGAVSMIGGDETASAVLQPSINIAAPFELPL